MAERFGNSSLNETIPGIIATCASFAVCFTIAIFPELRKLRYIELTGYVALNDMIASIGISLGATRNGSAACWFQGLSTNFNYLSAILWTTVITYQVLIVVHQKNIIKDLTNAHIICWGLPLLVTLLPLTTNTYANPDDGANWCFVSDRTGSPTWGEFFWFIAAFYAWLWIAMAINIGFICSIIYRFYRMQAVPEKIMSTMKKLLLYPIIITICWGLPTICDVYTSMNPEPTTEIWYIIDGLANVLAISQGFWFPIVFFTMNPLVRVCWTELMIEWQILDPNVPIGQDRSVIGSDLDPSDFNLTENPVHLSETASNIQPSKPVMSNVVNHSTRHSSLSFISPPTARASMLAGQVENEFDYVADELMEDEGERASNESFGVFRHSRRSSIVSFLSSSKANNTAVSGEAFAVAVRSISKDVGTGKSNDIEMK